MYITRAKDTRSSFISRSVYRGFRFEFSRVLKFVFFVVFAVHMRRLARLVVYCFCDAEKNDYLGHVSIGSHVGGWVYESKGEGWETEGNIVATYSVSWKFSREQGESQDNCGRAMWSRTCDWSWNVYTGGHIYDVEILIQQGS